MRTTISRLIAVAALCLIGGSSLGAVSNVPSFVITPNLGLQNFIQGTDSPGTFKTVYTGGTNGSKCTGLIASSTDGSATHLVTIQLKRSSTSYTTVAVTIPLSAGSASGTPPVNLMSSGNWVGLPIDNDGNPYFYLAGTGDLITATFATALTSATQINIVAVCGDF